MFRLMELLHKTPAEIRRGFSCREYSDLLAFKSAEFKIAKAAQAQAKAKGRRR